jgi:hypothetical protein
MGTISVTEFRPDAIASTVYKFTSDAGKALAAEGAACSSFWEGEALAEL